MKTTTTPIPEFAFASIIGRHSRIADQFAATLRMAGSSTTESAPDEVVTAALTNKPSRSGLALAREMVAAAALAASLHCNPQLPTSLAAEDFMAPQTDNAITRPALGFNDIKPDRPSRYQRGITSLLPMELTHDEAIAITQAMASGAARPTIKIVSLPQFKG